MKELVRAGNVTTPSDQRDKIRVHAVLTADDDGSRDSMKDHPDVNVDKCGYRYRIAKTDIPAMVSGANKVLAAARIRLQFDPDTDVEVVQSTLLNRDRLNPGKGQDLQQIFYRDEDQDIHVLEAGEKWVDENVTAAADGAPKAASAPLGYLTKAATERHLVYLGVQGHIHELVRAANWKHNPIGKKANAPEAAGRPFGYTNLDPMTGRMDVPHVVYRGIDGNIHVLFAGKKWHHRSLTALTNAPKAAGEPFGYTSYDAGTKTTFQHVVYRGVDGHIHELFAGDTWKHNVLTKFMKAPKAAGDPAAYTLAYGEVQVIVYRTLGGTIHQLVRTKKLHKQADLSAKTDAPKAASDPVGYTTNDYRAGRRDDHHVVFQDVNGDIQELYTLTKWHRNNLTATAQAPKSSGPIAAYTNANKTQQMVVYRDASGSIHQLSAGSAWQPADITAASGAKAAASGPTAMFIGEDPWCGIERNRHARTQPGKLVLYFRYGWGGWSNAIDDFVVMPSVFDQDDHNFLAHEIGHYLHLDHTHIGLTLDQARDTVRKYVESLAPEPESIPASVIARGLEAVDADRATVTDTPAELTRTSLDCGDAEPHPEMLDIVFRPDGPSPQSHTYKFTQDGLNVMNYQPKNGKKARLSLQQIGRIRHAVEKGNRRHLI